MKVLFSESCPSLYDPMNCSQIPHGISQARILEWVVIPFSRGPSRSRGQIWVSWIAGRFFTIWHKCGAPCTSGSWGADKATRCRGAPSYQGQVGWLELPKGRNQSCLVSTPTCPMSGAHLLPPLSLQNPVKIPAGDAHIMLYLLELLEVIGLIPNTQD